MTQQPSRQNNFVSIDLDFFDVAVYFQDRANPYFRQHVLWDTSRNNYVRTLLYEQEDRISLKLSFEIFLNF